MFRLRFVPWGVTIILIFIIQINCSELVIRWMPQNITNASIITLDIWLDIVLWGSKPYLTQCWIRYMSSSNLYRKIVLQTGQYKHLKLSKNPFGELAGCSEIPPGLPSEVPTYLAYSLVMFIANCNIHWDIPHCVWVIYYINLKSYIRQGENPQ